ncbi:MAG: hypothetical protein JNL57_04110 [Bacteroidetes bacterium]|nr:hypothetical protein [Bacteroidota bacterium]
MYLKFNGIRDLADARYASANMAEWIGFTVGATDSLPVSQIQEIAAWCSGPKLVLEAAAGTGTEVLQSMASVLPVDGIELNANDYHRVTKEWPDAPVFWIVRDDTGTEAELSHCNQLAYEPHVICKVVPGVEEPDRILAADPWAISIDCLLPGDGNSRDYTEWNDFFAALDMN